MCVGGDQNRRICYTQEVVIRIGITIIYLFVRLSIVLSVSVIILLFFLSIALLFYLSFCLSICLTYFSKLWQGFVKPTFKVCHWNQLNIWTTFNFISFKFYFLLFWFKLQFCILFVYLSSNSVNSIKILKGIPNLILNGAPPCKRRACDLNGLIKVKLHNIIPIKLLFQVQVWRETSKAWIKTACQLVVCHNVFTW